MVNRSLLYFILICVLFFLPLCEAVDTQHSIPAPEIGMVETFYPDSIVSHIYHADIIPHWIGNDLFWYADNGKEKTDYYLVNTTLISKKHLFDTDRFLTELGNASGKRIDPARIQILNPSFSPEFGTFSFNALGNDWSYDISRYKVTATNLSPAVKTGTHSPDGHYIAYVNGSNLWLYDVITRTDTPLTTDGTTDYFYGKRSDTVSYPVTEARLNESPSSYLVWSPDSQKIRTFKVDQRNVRSSYLLQQAPENGSLQPILYSYRFANPGDLSIPMYEPVVIDIKKKSVLRGHWKPQPETSMMDTDQYILQWWNKAGTEIYSLFIERGEKTLRFLMENPETGETIEVLNETGPTYREANLNYADIPNIAVLEKGGDIIWFSERDGWGHLYRYGSNGVLKNQVTSGDWVVRKLIYVDEENSYLYFTGSGKEAGNPYYQYLYRIHPDGTGLELLTHENGDRTISFSPDGKTFVESYSRVDLPPVTELKSSDGKLLMNIAEADITYLEEKGWKPPDQVSFKARDGITELSGLIFRSTNFNKDKKYPVVDIVYPGPYTIITTTRFPADLSWNSKIFWTSQMLAELGFVVVNMDGLGTAYRSKAFHDVSYGHLSDCGLPDHITGLKQLASKNSFMDLSRVGIYGKSAGGFMAAQAMLSYPAFFKVGVAASGNHDSRLYASFWGEKYEGMPEWDNYREQVTAYKAGNLSGDLLLLSGDMDDNVNPSMTMQLADALDKANKTFDMFVFTNKNHDLNYDPDYLRKMMKYFVDNL